jgi:hypothetical protein
MVYNTQNYWVLGICRSCLCTFPSTLAVGSLGKCSQPPDFSIAFNLSLDVFGFIQHHLAVATDCLKTPNIFVKPKIFHVFQHILSNEAWKA